ncbi:TPA: phage tail tape measure protein [Pasteurella multocida]|nr:phage tail tape measure protein [Pasteurella multocida]HED4406657.1 phage tail tape measure protein [Pasteurella multocida]
MNKGLNYTLKLTDKVTSPLQKVKNAFGGLSKGVKAVVGIQAAFAGTTAAVTAFLDRNLTALDNIHQLSNVTGAGAKAIFTLGKMAEVNGSSVEAAQSSIQGLSKVIGEAAKGAGKGAKAFKLYGLSAHDSNGKVKSTFAVLDDVRTKMKGLSQQEQIAMLSKLGIDQSMIQVLRLSNNELTDLAAKTEAYSLGSANKENAKHAAEFKDAMTELWQILRGAGQYIAVKLAPILTNIITHFSNWYVQNNQLVRNGLSIVINFLDRFLKTGFTLISTIHTFINSTIGWENAIWVLITVFSIAKKAILFGFLGKLKFAIGLAFSPLGAVVLIVVGLVALFIRFKAQIMAFLSGVLTGFQKWGISFEPIKAAVGRVLDIFTRLFSPVEQVTGGTEKFAAAGEIVGFIFGAAFDLILNSLTFVINGFAIWGEFITDVVTGIAQHWEAFTNLLTAGEWAKAFSMLWDGVVNIVSNVWYNIKVAAIQFINGLIDIVNKFGLGIKPIEIPIKPSVESMPMSAVAPTPIQVQDMVATPNPHIMPKLDSQGQVHSISAAAPRTTALDNHKGMKGAITQTNNNQRTLNVTINTSNSDPKSIAEQLRETENKELGR